MMKRQWRAPAEDGSALIDPPLTQIPAVIERNRRLGAEFESRTGIRRQVARFAVINASRAETRFDLERPIVLTGHQPELFHPGVWFKNFLACAIATRVGGHAANLVVDNDEARATSIRVPTIDGGHARAVAARVISVPFDDARESLPWEGRPIFHPETFREFAANVRDAYQQVIKDGPAFRGGILLDRFWPLALAQMEKEAERLPSILQQHLADRERPVLAGLGSVLTTARRQLEGEFGLSLQDHPVSHLVHLPTFQSFVSHAFDRHRELHAIYNAALAEYRAVNHVRSQSHPVPALVQKDDWYELPFWLWTLRDRRRRHALVRASAGGCELTDGDQTRVQLPRDAAQLFSALTQAGIRLRPRALMTTMYARLVLSDVFIHGIGGAKYDELTDVIIERFFGLEPPAYITATATFRLPIARPQVSLDDVRQSAERLRDLSFRPERWLRQPEVRNNASLQQNLTALAAEKKAYLTGHDLRRCPPDVFAGLERINAKMREVLNPVAGEAHAQHAALLEELRRSQLLGSREFSFVLFPSEILPARLLDLCKVLS